MSFSIKISHSDMSWTVHAYGKRGPTLSSVISGIPSAINTSSLKSLMLSLDECKVCCGNDSIPCWGIAKGKNIFAKYLQL